MSDWAYVAIAYFVVGGALTGYTVLLARRLSQARELARSLAKREQPREATSLGEDARLCDAPPAL